MKKSEVKKLDRDGVPIDRKHWTAADWQDLHEAITRAKRSIAKRHEAEKTSDSTCQAGGG